MEEYEIDDFEKLYAITAAEVNSPETVNGETFDYSDFSQISNLAKFKIDNPNFFSGENDIPNEKPENCYVIPINLKQKVRNGDEEVLVNKKAYLLTDSNGNVVSIALENGVTLPKASQDENKDNTLDEERLEPGEELEMDENRARLEASSLGVDGKMLEMLAEKYGCRVDQLSFRKIDDLERLDEDTGINARMYRGKVIALRINYGFQQRYFVINSETGEQFKLHRGEIETGNIPEVADYFKFPITRSNGKEDTSRRLSKDSSTARSYITYLDVNGNVKEAKFINNGKADDLEKEERERYIAEVAEADKVLEDVIDEYQNLNTQENWLRVKDAMKKRIQIDKKYRVLGKQKENTINTLDETIDETLEKTGKPKEEKSKDDDEDEWFTRTRH